MVFSSILTFFVLPVLTADCLVMAEPGVVPLLFPALVVIHSKLNSGRWWILHFFYWLKVMNKGKKWFTNNNIGRKCCYECTHICYVWCICYLNSIRELLALWWAHKWCIDFILENSESVEMVFCVLTQICNGVVWVPIVKNPTRKCHRQYSGPAPRGVYRDSCLWGPVSRRWVSPKNDPLHQ